MARKKSLIELRFDGNLGPLLRDMEANTRDAIVEVVDQTSVRVLKEIIFATPNNTGTARNGWVRELENGGLTAILKNDVPYIRVLEYGSYPVRAIRGTAGPSRIRVQQNGAIRRGRAYVGGNFAPGPRTVQAPGGDPPMLSPGNVSKAAPHGMLRKAIGEAAELFAFDLAEELDKVLAGEGEYRVASETIDPGRGVGLDILGGTF